MCSCTPPPLPPPASPQYNTSGYKEDANVWDTVSIASGGSGGSTGSHLEVTDTVKRSPYWM